MEQQPEIETIPRAVADYWPRLRRHFQSEILALIAEERDKDRTSVSFSELGVMTYTGEKLLKRFDAMMASIGDEPAPHQRKLPTLQTASTPREQ